MATASLPAIAPNGVPNSVPAASTPTLGHLPPRRNRSQLSCTHCRHGKLKCDRKTPCSPCVKRGRAAQCVFPPPAPRKKPAKSMHSRLRHLESLVKEAMNSQVPANKDKDDVPGYGHQNGLRNDVGAQSEPPLAGQPQTLDRARIPIDQPQMITSTPTDPESSGQVIQSVKETTYIGATHWAAILEDIEEVKGYFNETDQDDDAVHDSTGANTAMLFNFEPQTTKDDLLDGLPPRETVDKLVFRVFNSSSSTQRGCALEIELLHPLMLLDVIHKPTFQKQYNEFWTNPSVVSLSWLAQLYALMTLGGMAYLSAGQEHPDASRSALDVVRTYRSSCAQCLVLSNYTQPGPHTIEAFILYMESEFLLSNDEKVHCFLLVGSVVRLAFRMGLHRDPSRTKASFTPFQAEMRRRVWHVLFQIDLLASFHLGLPSMIQSVESDTGYPRNLRDEDFHEHISALPPSRPESDPAPILYLIAKSRICDAFAKIGAQANSLTPLSYDETLKLDGLLNASFAKVPENLRCKPLSLSVTESSELIMQRYNLALLYYRNLCVLHRRYLIKAREHNAYAYSRKAGLSASMEILSYQWEIYEAIKPGGPLVHDKWYLSSLPMHDFLLAATILSILVLQAAEEPERVWGFKDASEPSREEMIAALEKSYNIWKQTQDMSADTKRAFTFVKSMLKKIKSATEPTTNLHNGLYSTALKFSGSDQPLAPIADLSMNDYTPLVRTQNPTFAHLWPTETTDTQPLIANKELGFETMPHMEDLGPLLEMTTDFDWNEFDSHIRQHYQIPDPTFNDSIFDGI